MRSLRTSALIAACGLALAACGNRTKLYDPAPTTVTGMRPDLGGDTGAAGMAGQPGGTGGVAGKAGTGGGGASGGGTGGAGMGGAMATCLGGVTEKGQLIPLDIYAMIDQSGSMSKPTGATSGATRWAALTNALVAFVQSPSSAGVGVGVQYFPYTDPTLPDTCSLSSECGKYGPCGIRRFCSKSATGSAMPCVTTSDCDMGTCMDVGYCSQGGSGCFDAGNCPGGECVYPTICVNQVSCFAEDYASPSVPISALPAAAPALVKSINDHYPVGGTPTAPALKGAILYASEWAAAHTDHAVVVLLVTDGEPTLCAPTDIPGIAAIAASGADATPKVSTFAIGLASAGELDIGNLDVIAAAGGTEKAVLVDTTKDVTSQLLTAFESIRRSALACTYQLPVPPSGTLDFAMVNVIVTPSKGAQTTLHYVADASQCDPVTGGWHYDVEPSKGTPTKIVTCPATCASLKTDVNATVTIELGCVSI